jgi:hypothetical protein
VGGFNFDFEAVRTVSSKYDAPRRLKFTRTSRKRSTKLGLTATTGCWIPKLKNLMMRSMNSGRLLEN